MLALLSSFYLGKLFSLGGNVLGHKLVQAIGLFTDPAQLQLKLLVLGIIVDVVDTKESKNDKKEWLDHSH